MQDKIQDTKYVRGKTDWNLKEAKEAVEHIRIVGDVISSLGMLRNSEEDFTTVGWGDHVQAYLRTIATAGRWAQAILDAPAPTECLAPHCPTVIHHSRPYCQTHATDARYQAITTEQLRVMLHCAEPRDTRDTIVFDDDRAE